MLFLWGVLAAARQFGIFDAGSTGTRLNIYTFHMNDLVSAKSFHEEGGLAEFTEKDVEETITRLLERSRILRSVPIVFYGTAGLRALAPAQCQRIMGAAARALANYNLWDMRVISGDSEGFYVMKALRYIYPDLKNFIIVDMGGGSVQTVKKNGDAVDIRSLELGIRKSQCLDKEPENEDDTPFSGFMGYMNARRSTPYAQYEQKSGCVLQLLGSSNVPRIAPTGGKIPTFLLSVFFDIFGDEGPTNTLAGMIEAFNRACGNAKMAGKCTKMYYAIKLLRWMGFASTDQLIIVREPDGINLTWALGRAVELNQPAMHERVSEDAIDGGVSGFSAEQIYSK